MVYNAFNVYCRELAPSTVSITGDRAQGDDSKYWAYSKENGMLINTTKPKVMLFTTPQKRVYLNNYNFQLTYNNEALSEVT